MKKIGLLFVLCFTCLLSGCKLFYLDAAGYTTIGILGVSMNVNNYDVVNNVENDTKEIKLELRLKNTEKNSTRTAVVNGATYYTEDNLETECAVVLKPGYTTSLYYLDYAYYTITVTVDINDDLDTSTIVYTYNSNKQLTITLHN